jgi:glucokinase
MPAQYSEKEYLSPAELAARGFNEGVIVGDVGGTNTRIALFAVAGADYQPVLSLGFRSRELDGFPAAVNISLNRIEELYGLSIRRGAVSGAGPVEEGVCRLTNLDWRIDVRETLGETVLSDFHLINDFSAIGYGLSPLEKLRPDSLVTVVPGGKEPGTVKAVIGAGTGLGKGFLIYDRGQDVFVPYPSEGGHEIFSPTDETEFELMRFVQKSLGVPQVIFEHLVTGSGIVTIYRFLRNEPGLAVEAGEIAENCAKDPLARRAIDLFTIFYARTAKNSALNLLPYSGVYLAGGIIARIIGIMDQEIFRSEFTTHPKHSRLLNEFSVQAVVDYDVSLYGLVDYLVNFT